MIGRVLLLAAVGSIVAVFVAGLVSASRSHSRPIRCPKGWTPNTGFLQRGCVPK